MSYKRKLEDNRRLHRLYEQTFYHYGRGVYYDNKKHRLIKWDNPQNKKKFIKRYANHKVRKYLNTPNHNGYRKIFDIWWQIW